MPRPDPALFSAARWQPLPRPHARAQRIPIRRLDSARDDNSAAGLAPVPGGTAVLSRGEEWAVVRFRHHAPSAWAVALQANGWWHPDPPESCDLRPTAGGWWEGTFEVPADWRVTYGFVEHHGPGEPPWWAEGLKAPGGPVVADATSPRGHRAGRGGELRSLLSVPDDGPFGLAPRDTSCLVQELVTAVDEPRVRWWAPGPGEPGSPLPGSGAPLTVPLLVVTDGEAHVDHLGTPGRLQHAVATGALPPLAAVFVDSGPARVQVLGRPGGHARWIARDLLPRLQEQGLASALRIGGPTVVTGSSFGALTSLFALAQAPGRVDAVIAQSTSLWRYADGALAEPLQHALRERPAQLRLQAGCFEGTLASTSQALVETLRAGGADASLTVHSGGHDWAWWQPLMLRELATLLR